MESIANFDATSINNAVAEYGPAQVVVRGLTVTEKKLSAAQGAGTAALAYLSNTKGKVGKAAREGLSAQGEEMIARAARKGNYAPLAQSIAAIMGESLTISNRAAFECLADRFNDKLRDLKGEGFILDKKTNAMKPTSKRNELLKVIGLIVEVQSMVAAM